MNASRRLVVQCNIAGGDIAGVTQEIERRLHEQVAWPAGYHVEMGGEYQEQLKARHELLLLGIASLIGIFLLLYGDFHSTRDAMLVLRSLPLALIGAVWAVVLVGGLFTSTLLNLAVMPPCQAFRFRAMALCLGKAVIARSVSDEAILAENKDCFTTFAMTL